MLRPDQPKYPVSSEALKYLDESIALAQEEMRLANPWPQAEPPAMESPLAEVEHPIPEENAPEQIQEIQEIHEIQQIQEIHENQQIPGPIGESPEDVVEMQKSFGAPPQDR